MIKLLKRLWCHINPLRRWQFIGLQTLMLITAFAELLSIGAVLPFLGVLTNPESIYEHHLVRPFILELGLTNPSQLILPLTIVFVAAAFFACILRVLLLWVSISLSYATGSDLSNSVYHRTLYQPYAIHCGRNSSELITGITIKSHLTITTISSILNIITSVVMLLVIITALVALEPIIALITFSSFGLIYIIITRLAQKKLLSDSVTASIESARVTKALQEGLGGIRDILIDGSQATYSQIYRQADFLLRKTQGHHTFISASPRFFMETLGMVLIAALAYSLAKQPDGMVKAIPILGALALGAQRLLPILQNIYSSWSGILGNQASLKDYLDLLDQPLPNYVNQEALQPMPFNRVLTLKQLSFRYSKELPYVLKKLNLNIYKGSCIGIIGNTGCGKSTLIDIITGLLDPTVGAFEVDGHTVSLFNNRSWQAHIAHVPQAIFLADASIEENIAFGVPKDLIDFNRVRQAAQKAQISESINDWPKKYKTIVGERGIRLSGGQRQRIGIARAMYKQADVIIFDEATSALDNETEQVVMQTIENLSKELTIIIIAHRLTTLKNCNQIIELRDGVIKRTGNYQEIVSNVKLGDAYVAKIE